MDSLTEVGAFFGFGVAEDINQIHRKDDNQNVTPEFLLTVEPDIIAAKREGRPIYRDRETVILHVAGDQFDACSKPVDEQIKRRFHAEYDAWKADHDASLTISGTPLKKWPLVGPAQVAELAALKIYNVEGLAGVADVNLNRSPTLRDLRTKAIAWLAQAKGGAEVTRLASENKELQDQLSGQAEQIKLMQAQMTELLAARHKKAV